MVRVHKFGSGDELKLCISEFCKSLCMGYISADGGCNGQM